MEKIITCDYGDKKNGNGYYDGIPDFIKKMSLEELESSIKEEKKRCENLNTK